MSLVKSCTKKFIRIFRVATLSRARILTGALMATLLLGGAGAQAASAYQNPFTGDSYRVGRTDMGVDVCLTPGEPIRAIGDGVVVGINRNWFEGQPYLWYRLSRGPYAGRYVYVAEQINDLVPVGRQLHHGDIIARFASRGTCIEIGWGTRSGWTLAQVTTGYKEGQRTTAGISFAHFLINLDVRGAFQL